MPDVLQKNVDIDKYEAGKALGLNSDGLLYTPVIT